MEDRLGAERRAVSVERFGSVWRAECLFEAPAQVSTSHVPAGEAPLPEWGNTKYGTITCWMRYMGEDLHPITRRKRVCLAQQRIINGQVSLENLWNSAQPSREIFDSARISGFPEGAQQYLWHAIADGTPLASAVRLRMHGEIKLKNWRTFSAEEVICWGRGMIWQAAVRMRGVPIRGADSFVDGRGAMRWKLFGIVPIVNASGPDIARSAAGRVNIESIWLPSVLVRDEVLWTGADPSRPHAQLTAHNEIAEIDYDIDDKGSLKSVGMPRWGNLDGPEFRYSNCGGFVEQEGNFDGYTIPVHMHVDWHFGAEQFESEGEFFRVTIDDAVYR